MIALEDVTAAYGRVQILHGVRFAAEPGEITCLAGRNGAGKSTTLKAIMGLVAVTGGTISLNARPIHALPSHQIPREGVGYIPQGRRLFPALTVAENIDMGLMTRGEGQDTRDWVLGLFPVLGERLSQMAGTLSGGEQQMLATARALALRPRVLLLDEPTEGLQPSIVAQIRHVILSLKAEGIAIILVEQRIDAIRALADKVVLIERGKSLETLDRAKIETDPQRLETHLGV